jgi:ABC-type branched-subunit amino acid transport system substrate-binding protein
LRAAAAALAVAVGAGAAVDVVPTDSGASGSGARVGTGIPASAMTTHTGITPTTVTVGNISTQFETLFTGAAVGTEAYADYVDARGGVNGRKIVVTSQNTGFSGTTNAKLTQESVAKDFALVGGFSITATSASQILASDPGMPDVSVTITPATNKLPNLVNPVPVDGGWEEGGLLYFKGLDPAGALKAGAMLADEDVALEAWRGEEATMEHLGYKVAYQNTYAVSSKYNTFVADVIAMKSKGVKMLFIEQNPPLYAAPLIRAMNSQDFHPFVVLGSSTYGESLIPTAGGAKDVDGMYFELQTALFLGQDAKVVPAVTTFLHWVQVAKRGWKPDLFTLYGWLSAELFAEGLKKAGRDPSRGSLLQALGTITEFTGTHLEVPVDPAAKSLSNCYLVGRIENGNWTRVSDPPTTGKTHGYRCTDQYYVPPGAGQ